MMATLEIESRMQQLLDDGALPVDPSFAIANENQGEVIFQDRRLLLTPRDELWEQYADVMGRAEVPSVAYDQSLSNDDVVVGEIPRDARALPRIMRSRQPEHGLTSMDVFRMLGATLGQVVERTHMVPQTDDLPLERILVLRNQPGILLLPTLRFVAETDETNRQLTEHVKSELDAYSPLGAVMLAGAFNEGLNYGVGAST
jgi:hypothetical protein